MFYTGKADGRLIKKVVQVRWNRPSSRWCELHSDGSSLGNLGRASGGGLIRDSNGVWIKRFTCNIGTFLSVEAELWALKDGLSLCISLNIMALEIEVDVAVILDLMLNGHSCNLNHFALIMDCRALINLVQQVRIMRCFREANKCAVALAQRGPITQQDFVIYDNPPTNIVMLLFYDNIGMYYERTCPQIVVSFK